MPRTTIVKNQSTSVTTSETNLLGSGTITAGSNANAVPIGDCDAYSIAVHNAGAQDITLRLYLAGGSSAALREQSAVTATVASGADWTYQMSGNAMRFLALTGQTGASTATVTADFNGVVFS